MNKIDYKYIKYFCENLCFPFYPCSNHNPQIINT